MDPVDSKTEKQLEPEKEKLSGKGIEKEPNVTLPELEDVFEEIDLQQLLNLTDSDFQNILELDPDDSTAEKQLESEKEKLSGKGIENESNVYNCKQCDSTYSPKT